MSEYTDDTPRFLTGNRSKPFPTDDDLLTDNVTYPEVPPSAQPGLDTNSPPKSFLTGRHAKLFPDQIQLPDHGFCESNNAPFVLTGARSKPFGRLSRSSSGKKSAFTLERPGSSHISLLHGNENEMNEDKPASPTGKHTKQIALVANSLFTTAEAPFSLAQEEQQDTSMPPDNDMQDPNSAFLNGGLAKLVSSSANTSSTTNTSLLPNNGVDDVNPAFLTGRHAKAFPKAPSIKNVAFTVERPEPSNPSLTPLNGKGSHVSAFTLERPGYPESDTSDDANPAFLTGKQAKPLPKSTSVKSVAFTLERPHRAQSSTLNDTNPAFLTGKHAKPFPRFSSSKSVAFVGDRPEPGENQLFPGDSGHETAFLTGKSAKAFPITADPFSLDTSPEQSSRHPHARESSDVRDGAPPPLFVAGTFARGISSGHSDGQSSNSPQITGHQRNKKEDSIARFHSEGQCARFALSNDDALEEGSLESYDSRQPLQGKSASHDNERPSFQPGTFARSFSPVAAGKLGQRLSSLAGATVQPSPTDGSEANGIQVYFTDQSAAEDSSSMSADFPQSEPGPPRARRHPSALGNSTPADPRASVHGSGYSLDSFRPTQNVTSMGRQRKSSRNAQQTTSISPSDGSSLSSFTSYLNIRFGREKAILSSSSGAPLTFRTHGFRKAFTPWLFRTVLSIKGMVLLLFMFTLLTCCLFLGYYKDMQDRRSIERLAHTILGTAALDVRNAISVEVQAIESYCRMNVDLYRAGHWTTATFVEPSALFWSSLRLFSFPTLWLGRNILAPPLYSGNILGAQHLEENLWLRWSEFNRTHTAADYFDEEGRFLYSDPPFNQEDQPWVTVHFALSREEQNIGHWTPLFAFHNALYQSYTVPIYAPDNETMEFVMGVDFTTDFLYALVDRSKENNPMHPDIVVMGMDGHVIATTFANAQVISMSPTGVPYTTAALDSPISLIRTAAKAVLEISPDNAYTSLTELRALHVSDEKHQSFFVTVVPYSSATGMRVIIFHILSHQVVFDPLKATLRNTALVVAGFVLTLTIVIMILLHYITQPLLDIKKAMNALFDESEINSTPYKRTYTKNSVAEVSSPGAAATAEMHDDPERGHGQPSLARSTRSAASSTRTLAERRNTSFVIKRLSRLSEISDLQGQWEAGNSFIESVD
ncbi:hypothetical protein DFJ77DRAFT_163824 [Powellomyces hirtus]|nr:hypothetical protein DFJ77DRAFT_163824 [Powellomyces hirtus]